MKNLLRITLLTITIFSCKNEDIIKLNEELLNVDKSYSTYSIENGADKAFDKFGASELLMLSSNSFAVIDRSEIIGQLPTKEQGTLKWFPEKAEVAKSGELGYTWGNYEFTFRNSAGSEESSFGKYLNIWKRDSTGNWKWIVDMGNKNPYFKKSAKFDETRNPQKDLEYALIDAGNSGKKVLLDVGGEWCKWCHFLDEFFEANSEIKRLLNQKFIVVKVNYSKTNKNENFLNQFPKVSGYPHFFVIDSNGDFLLSKNTAELEEGNGYSKEKMTTFLNSF